MRREVEYKNVKVEEIKDIIAKERQNLGKLHPVTDTRFRNGESIIFKYAYVFRPENGLTTINILWEMGHNINSNQEYPAEMWYSCDEYEVCKEDAIIGWLFEDELFDALA